MSPCKALGALWRSLAGRLPSRARERLLGPPPWRRRNRLRAGVAISFFTVAMTLVVTLLEPPAPTTPATVWLLAPSIVMLAFLFQSLDATTGMGFGTALTPLLFAAGYGPLDVVPALLIAQAFTGLLSGWLHQELENVRFSARLPLDATTLALVIVAGVGVAGTILSIWLAYVAIRLPDRVIEAYVALLVIVMGLSVLVRREGRSRAAIRLNRLIGFALIAGANKGIGGGGYGPVVTLGAIHAGLPVKSAVALTVLAEGLVSAVGAGIFLVLGDRLDIDFSLLPSLLTGSFAAALAAPFAVSFLPARIFRVLVPCYALLVGAFVLGRLYLA